MKLIDTKHVKITVSRIKFKWSNLFAWIIFIGMIAYLILK